MKKTIMWLSAVLGLAGLTSAWADSQVTTIPWSGSFFIDNRAVKTISTEADLKMIQPIVVKTRDTKVTETNPDTGLKTELERTSSATNGTGLIVWAPTASGKWVLSSSRDGSATFDVAWAVFHAGEDGTSAATAYTFASTGAFLNIATNEAYNVGVGTYIRPDMNWLTLSDLHAVMPTAIVDEEAKEVKFVEQADGSYIITLLGDGEAAPYYGIWGDAAALAEVNTSAIAAGSVATADTAANIRLDTEDIHSAATPKAFSAAPVNGTTTGANILWPFTFEANQAGSISVKDPNSGATSYLTGRASRPDGSGTVAWEPSADAGGIYEITLGSNKAYFSIPYPAISGDGSLATPYLLTSTNSLLQVIGAATPLAAGDYIQLTGSTSIKTMSDAIVYSGYGFELVDQDQKLYKYVLANDGTVPSYQISKKFELGTTARGAPVGVYAVDSLDDILSVKYSGGNVWAFDNGIEATVSTAYYANGTEEGEPDSTESETVTGRGELEFAPEANGLYVLTHTSKGETLTAKFTVGEPGTAVESTYSGTVATVAEFNSAVNTIGYKTMNLELGANLQVAAADYEKGALTIPASVENLTIDLKGFTLAGFDASAEVSPVRTAPLRALIIKGTNTNVTVTDSVGGGMVRGGNGLDDTELLAATTAANAILFPEYYTGTFTVSNTTVKGGNGGSSTHAGNAGEGRTALEFRQCTSGKVVVGENGVLEGGDGGSSTVADGARGDYAIYVAPMSPTTEDTETGYVDIEVCSTGKIVGGKGGDSANKKAGNGIAAIYTPLSSIVSGTLTLAEGAIVKAGDAGDAGVLGQAGTAAVAVQGTATVDGDEEAALQGGEAGSYVVNSQEDLDILAENYASKADGNEINIKIGEDAAGEDLTIDSKIESANIDLNGNSVASITVNGETETTIGDNSGSVTPGSVGTVTAAGGASVDVNGGSVGTVEADNGTSVNVNGGSVTNISANNGSDVNVNDGSVGTVSAENGTSVNVNGGTVTEVEAGDDTSVALNGGTTGTVESTAGTNPPVVVVAPGVTEPEQTTADGKTPATSATYINNESHTIDAAGAYILNGNIDSTLEVGYAVTIDLNGYTITGTSGASEAEDGQSAIKPTAAVAITVTGEGTLTGGNGADGASTHGAGAEAVGEFEGATVDVADTVTQVKGDDGFASDNMPTIKIVKMVQRYPWNGYVDIDYTLTGENFANISIELAFTNAEGDSQTAQKWIVEPTVEAGTHRMTWNAAAEFAKNYVSKDVKVTVKLVRKVVAE